MQAKKDTTELQEKSKVIKKSIAAAEESAKELADARDRAIMPIGNLVPDSVPVSKDEVSSSARHPPTCCWGCAEAIMPISNQVPVSMPASNEGVSLCV